MLSEMKAKDQIVKLVMTHQFAIQDVVSKRLFEVYKSGVLTKQQYELLNSTTSSAMQEGFELGSNVFERELVAILDDHTKSVESKKSFLASSQVSIRKK